MPEEKSYTAQPQYRGFASSMFQTSGDICGPSNWTLDPKVPAVGKSVSHWDNYKSDIDLMAQSGANSYRFSLEWSQIEPEPGRFNEAALNHYNDIIDYCLQRNITPMVTLLHFVEPAWFTERGGFEKQENVEHFVNFSKEMFKRFHNKVPFWCTINEPAVQAFSGYVYGQFPPHEHNPLKAVRVLKHLLMAHVDTYQALKSMEGGDKAQVGIVHNVLKFKPRYPHELIERWLASFLTTITNEIVIRFFKTGDIHYRLLNLPFMVINHHDDRAPKSNDFFGLNYYADPVIGFNTKNIFGPTCFPGQEMGDMYLPIDPQGLSDALDLVAQLGVPIHITETGIADKDDRLRGKLVKAYVKVIQDKIKNGVRIEGVDWWTIIDNYEWNEGYDKHFGFFKSDRTPRPSLQILEAWLRDPTVNIDEINLTRPDIAAASSDQKNGVVIELSSSGAKEKDIVRDNNSTPSLS